MLFFIREGGIVCSSVWVMKEPTRRNSIYTTRWLHWPVNLCSFLAVAALRTI